MPTLATTSRAQLAYIKETSFGVTPNAGNGTSLRMTGESLDFGLTKTPSNEIRADRQVGSTTTVDASAAGSVNFHMQYREYDPFLEALMSSTYSVYGTNGVGTTFSGTYASTTITAAVAPTGANAFTTLQGGQWLKVNAPSGVNDGKWVRVSTTVAPTTTVITLDPGTPLSAEGPIANSTIATSRLANGVTETSFSLEKQLTDVGQYFTYRGMSVSKMSLNFASAALTDGSMDFTGKDMLRSTATQLPGSQVASQVYDIQNGVRGMSQLWEGGSPVTGTYIKTLSLSVDNNLRERKALANLGNVSIGRGDFTPTGQMEVYFADGSLFDKYLGDVYTSLVVATQDSAGNGYVMTLPRVMLMTGKVTAGAKNQDVMAQFTFTGYADLGNATAGLQKTMFIDRLGAAAA